MKREYKNMGEVITALYTDEYYETVAWGFMEQAVEDAVREHGTFKNIEELNRYIKENLI